VFSAVHVWSDVLQISGSRLLPFTAMFSRSQIETRTSVQRHHLIDCSSSERRIRTGNPNELYLSQRIWDDKLLNAAGWVAACSFMFAKAHLIRAV